MATEKRLIELVENVRRKITAWHTAEDVADMLIANGVTIPVRCKDCTSYCSFEISKMYGKMQYCSLTGLPTDPCDFCSYGERRKNA